MSLLNIGTSALLTNQGALSTTGHNISNVNTEGYNRQRVEQGTRIPNFEGGYYIGSGVQIDDVQRLFDRFLADQVRLFSSQKEQLATFTTFSKQVDDLLGSESLSISNSLSSFFDAVQGVADDPTSIAARQVMLTEADTLAKRFNTIDSQLTAFNDQVNLNLQANVADINSLTQGIAQINQAIAEADGAPGAKPNDLLDKRDQLINQLSKLVSVSTVQQSNGVLNVFIGNGQPVVNGNSFNALTTVQDPSDATRLQIAFNANQQIVSNQITGGKLGGLLTVRRDVIDPARTEINALAAGIINGVNAQHRTGLTLNGQAGGNFFEPADPLGAPTPNAGNIRLAISNPRDIAIAFPVNLANSITNNGTGRLEILAIDSSDPLYDAANVLAGPVGLAFDSATNQYTVSYNGNTATLAYNPSTNSGQTFNLANLTFSPANAGPPLSIKLQGVPANGDSFTINNSTAGGFSAVGDNRNALALAQLQVSKTLDPNGTGTPTLSFGDAYGILVANVATRTKQADVGRATQEGLLNTTKQRYDSISGVNLDEEAANLIKYQQSYQAAAQIITVSNTIFDTLINSF